MTNTRLYSIWEGIINRCYNENNTHYSCYGGRGIKCLWKSFEEFKADMYESYQIHVEEYGENNTSIDRIDVNGDYCLENCRWATKKEQANNKTTTWLINYNGQTQSASQWAEELGIKYDTIKKRKYKYGYIRPEDLLAKPHKAPIRAERRGDTVNGKANKK